MSITAMVISQTTSNESTSLIMPVSLTSAFRTVEGGQARRQPAGCSASQRSGNPLEFIPNEQERADKACLAYLAKVSQCCQSSTMA